VPRTTLDDASCPACQSRGLEYNAETIDLPYLGESLETMIRCNACGYRHTDFILTASKEPTRHSFTIAKEDDMMIRVVRSASGTIRIPELGIMIEPGIASEAFISNIEGILVRVERVLSQLFNDAETTETKHKVEALQDTLISMRGGGAPPVTLVFEDPFGNSAILDPATVIETIPADEAEQLKTGMHIIDRDQSVGME
jgi:zinc finger protein